ncbi:hypothetical protein RJ640_024384 [Escallonia rubra]|uniref:O-fucosyltransferase family protein n=1 Tax=Escallonia rubra TaxID=112253 RepID=A0AA88RL74_9ASTE|nr:hypothetical protein RJ640_024384 [Escallonia rubra]
MASIDRKEGSDMTAVTKLSAVWRYKRKLKEQKPCLNTTTGRHLETPEPVRYLIVEANGGLNQQRSSICNAVAVAGLLNATLIIPRFEFHNVWRDPRKALLTWDDSDESDKEGSEDEDVAQLCFMANDDDPKVTPENHFNELK